MSKANSDISLEEQIKALEVRLSALQNAYDVVVKDNNDMAEKVSALEADHAKTLVAVDALTKERDFFKAQNEFLIEKIRLAAARMWAPKSEKLDPKQLSLFVPYSNDAEVLSDTNTVEPEIDEVVTKKRRRGGKRTIDLDALESVIIEHTLEDALCPECGSTLKDFKVEVTKTLRMMPAHLVVEEHRRHVYICEKCSNDNAQGKEAKTQIVRAPLPNSPIPKSFASASLIAYVLYQKFANAMPLYRIQKDFEHLGITLTRQTQANWVINVYERWLHLIHKRMKYYLLQEDVIHADETEVQVLKEDGRSAKQKSRMWLFASGAFARPNYIFEYRTTRSGSVAREFLKGWSGYLTTDGYSPYFSLGANITNTACLVHIERKFKEVLKGISPESNAYIASVANEAIKRISHIMHTDNKLDDLAIDARKKMRKQKVLPLLEDLYAWVNENMQSTLPKMALGVALEYAHKYLPYTMRVCEDGRLSLDNNLAERAIRPFTIGRKNWLFADTPKGASASAALYSIVTSAKANGLNVYKYLVWLLEVMPNAGALDDKALDTMLPFSDLLPAELRLPKDKAIKQRREMGEDPIIPLDSKTLKEIEALSAK